MWMLLITLVVLLLIFLSVRERARRRLTRGRDLGGLDVRDSPLASALATLVGTAGGIYLSMVMLITFLGLDVPSKIKVLDLNVEPLAAVSLLLAIVQPFFMRIFDK